MNVQPAIRGVRQRLAHILMPPSFPPPGTYAFYRQQPSCQIPSLWYLLSLFLGESETGTFVEVGANDGVSFSNTWGLAERGWQGYLVEPLPELAEAARRNHAMHSQVQVLEYAVAAPSTTHLDLHVAGPLTTANTSLFDHYSAIPWASEYCEDSMIKVPAIHLDGLLERIGVTPGFEVLVVDVEGFESEVFSGFSLEAWRPVMLIVELVDTHPELQVTASTDARLGVAITDCGYRVVYKDQLNTVFVRRERWQEVFDFST